MLERFWKREHGWAQDDALVEFECYFAPQYEPDHRGRARQCFSAAGAAPEGTGDGYESDELMRGWADSRTLARLHRRWLRGAAELAVISEFLIATPGTGYLDHRGDPHREVSGWLLLRGNVRLYDRFLQHLQTQGVSITEQASNNVSCELATVNATLILRARYDALLRLKRLLTHGWRRELLDPIVRVCGSAADPDPRLPTAVLVEGDEDRLGLLSELRGVVRELAHVKQSDARYGLDGAASRSRVVLRLIPNSGIKPEDVLERIALWCDDNGFTYKLGEWVDAEPPDECSFG